MEGTYHLLGSNGTVKHGRIAVMLRLAAFPFTPYMGLDPALILGSEGRKGEDQVALWVFSVIETRKAVSASRFIGRFNVLILLT